MLHPSSEPQIWHGDDEPLLAGTLSWLDQNVWGWSPDRGNEDEMTDVDYAFESEDFKRK